VLSIIDDVLSIIDDVLSIIVMVIHVIAGAGAGAGVGSPGGVQRCSKALDCRQDVESMLVSQMLDQC
jgi:hypothetical protein